MPLAWPELLLAGSLVGAAPLAAQQGKELGVQAVGTASDPALAVAGVYGGLRTSVRTRASVAAGLGASADQLAFRGEVLGHFLLSPNKRVGPGFYFAGGVAAVAGPVERGYLVLAVGLEDRPAAASGWGIEVGVGGGLRVLLGYRWRWLRTAPAP
ncbi:MAG TPA: hypothetical protein VNO19_12020 [Gemmatimonadales bacterium]|nr:hypothetical protein [Gemmatimonadales bacterium]